MNKISILALVGLALCGSAFAQKAAPGAKAAPKTLHCAVMPKDTVDIAAATKNKMFADYKGNRYFFCCAGCPAAFKADPSKFAKAEHIKSPVVTKKTKKA